MIMASKHCIILLIFVAVTITEAEAVTGYTNFDASNTFVQVLGRLAVNEYNSRSAGSHLKLVLVYGGYTIFGDREFVNNSRPRDSFEMEYHLDLTAANCSQSEALANYTAVVRVTNIGTLVFVSFKPKIN